MPRLLTGDTKKPPKPPRPKPVTTPPVPPGRAKENAQEEVQRKGRSGETSVTAGTSRTPRSRTVDTQEGGGTSDKQKVAAKEQRDTMRGAAREEAQRTKRDSTDAGSVRKAGSRVGSSGSFDRTGRTRGGTTTVVGRTSGGGGDFGGRRFGGDRGGLPETGGRPVTHDRPTGWDRGYEDGLDFGGGGGTATGGGGGGAAGSNPLSATAIAAEKFKIAEGQSVEDVVQAQGAKKTRKQRRREATY